MSQLKHVPVGLIFILLQITLLDLLSIKGVRPDLIVLFVVGRALSGGPTAGVLWGFGIGLLIDAVSGAQFGLGAFAYTLTGFVSGQLSSEKGTRRTRYLSALALGAVMAFTAMLYFREPWDKIGWTEPFLMRALPGAFYTWFIGSVWVHSPFAHLKAGKGRV